MREALTNPLSKIEGTFAMFNLRAVAKEFSVAYNEMKIIEDNYSLDTATGSYLDAKANDYGMERRYARPTWGYVTFSGNDGVAIPANTVVAAPDYGVQFTTVGDAMIVEGVARVSVNCLTLGTAGNVPAGSITQIITEIPGISGVTNDEVFTGGTDRENDDDFRDRIYFKIQNPATSGNKNHYKQWATEVSGVGKVKVFSLWNGPGTVKVSVIDSNGEPATPELIDEVQAHIDPEPQQQGEGEAPVGAMVTVTTAEKVPVNISATVEIGVSGDLDQIKEAFIEALKTYFAKIAYDGVTDGVSVARVGYTLLDVPGVIDYTGLMLNGDTATVKIGEEQIVSVGEVSLTAGGSV